jgi:predicted MarR family transcription regulator
MIIRSARTKPASTGRKPVIPSGSSKIGLQLSDLEFTLIVLVFGFSRWIENCMDAAGARGLSALDVLVLHTVNHRARGRRLAEICMVLNIDDTHLVGYALKKLVAAGLVALIRQGRERHYETTEWGDKVCLEYRLVREKYLVGGLGQIGDLSKEFDRTGKFLRTMSALYDQAGRFATAESYASHPPPPVRTKR